MGQWDRNGEGATLPLATSHRDEWDIEDLTFVAAFRDDPDTTDIDLALALGRSLYAVQAIKSVLDERLRRRVSREKTEARRNVGFDFVTTFPPGWFD